MGSTNLDLSINLLKEYSIDMITKCENTLKLSMESILEKDRKKAKKVREKDYEINKLREIIRDESIELIALRQPLAKDLRYIHSISIIANELERIGDYAVNIANETLAEDGLINEVNGIYDIYIICKEMIEKLKIAIETENVDLCHEIAKKDDLIDELYKKVRTECVKTMNERQDVINQGIQVLFIARHLERIGDHITNICEKIIYVAQGEVVSIG